MATVLSLNIPILYFTDLTVSGTITMSVADSLPPPNLPNVYMYLKVDKTKFFSVGLNSANGGGFRYLKLKSADGVVNGVTSVENDNVDFNYLLQRLAAGATDWQINYGEVKTGATYTVTSSIGNRNGNVDNLKAADLNTALGKNQTGVHVMAVAASAYKGMQVLDASTVFGTSTATGVSTVQNTIATAVRSYLSNTANQTNILNTIIERNLAILPADSGYLLYEQNYGDIALMFNMSGFKFDINKTTSVDNMNINNVYVCLHLTSSSNI